MVQRIILPGLNVRKIVHISDLHIRSGDKSACRFDEYMSVFNNLYNTLSIEGVCDDTIVIITGDLFHNKSKIESAGIVLFYSLIGRLAQLASVFIIQGNHDYRQDQHDTPDLISALLHEKVVPNVYYLDTTAHYIIGNIGIGLVSIKDALKAGDTCGQEEELPEFPDPSDFNDVKTKIALFHGTVNGCTLQNYAKSPTGYPMEWFKGYDLTLLGDVHLQQLHNIDDKGKWKIDTMPWGYPGSLIQQNFGETIFDHGMFVWNLDDKSVQTINIRNDYGYITIKESEDGWLAQYKKKWISINKILDNSLCPSNITIRINTNDSNYDEHSLASIMGSPYNINYVIQTINMFDVKNENSDAEKTILDEPTDMGSYNTPTAWINYLQQHITPEVVKNMNWKQWIINNDSLMIDSATVPSTLHDKVRSKNEDIMKSIQILQATMDKSIVVRKSLTLNYMEWSWILCFKDGCHINFDELKGNVCTINAMNGQGKSSFLEVICIALFGEPIPSRFNKENSASIICLQKPTGERPKVSIEFTLNGKMYRIFKAFTIQYGNIKGKKLQYQDHELAEISVNREYTVIHTGKTAVDNWVQDNIGNIESFLLSGMVTQNCDQDFFNMKSDAQTYILEKYLNLDSIHDLQGLLKSASLSYKSICDSLDDLSKWSNQNITNVTIDEFKAEKQIYRETVKTRKEIEKNHEAIVDKWHDISIVDIMLHDNDISSKILETETIIKSLSIVEDYDALQQEYGMLKNKLLQLPKPSNKDVLFTQNHLDEAVKKCQDKQSEIQSLLKEQPFKPLQTLEEWEEWNKNFIEFNKIIIKKYGSMKFLLGTANTNSVSAPSIDEETLKSQKALLDEEVKKITDAELWLNDETLIENKIKIFGDKVREMETIHETLVSHKNKIEDNYSTTKESLDICTTKLRNHMKNYVALPNQSEEDYIEWFSDFEQYESDASNTESKLTKCLSIIEKVKVTNECIRATEKDIERINYDISVIKDAQHPYNDDCWACRQQTWKVHLTNLGDQLINCKEQLDLHHKTKASLLGKRTLERLQKITQEYQSWYDDWNEMKSEKAAWETLRMQWAKYKPFHKKLVGLEEQEQELSKQIVEINTQLKSLKKEEQEASANYKNSKQEYNTLLICKENLPRWKSTSSMIKKHNALWVEYKKRLESINDANKANEYFEENKDWELIKSQLNDYEKWDTKLNILKDQYSQYDIECKSIEAYLSQEQLLKIKENIDKHTTKKQMERELSYWTNIRDLKPDFNQKAELSTRLEQAKENERIAAAKYHQVEIMYKQCENARTEANSNKQTKTNLMEYKIAIDHIAENMSYYRKEVYEKHVMPKLLAETNKIVAMVTNSNDLLLDVDVDASKPKTSLSWYFQHGKNRPPIEKASGFQRYMLGLGIRIAMSYAGACSVSCNQLFIDEGFVACDTEHLSRVPDFLQNLLNLYSSIIMVSHLDELKDCASIQIPIIRKNDLSMIQFGQKGQKVQYANKKKRGRPARVIE